MRHILFGLTEGEAIRMVEMASGTVANSLLPRSGERHIYIDTHGPVEIDAAGTVRQIEHTQLAVRTETGNYTIQRDDDVILGDATSGTITFTLPPVADAFISGKTYKIKKIEPISSANRVIVDGDGAEQIDHAATATLTARDESISVVSDGTQWRIV